MWCSIPFCRAQDVGKLAVPGTSDLLRAEPFDRIALIDNSVLLVEPVSPRPLPPSEKENEARRRGRDKQPVIPPEGNIIVGVPTKTRATGPEGSTPTASRVKK